MIVAMKAVSVIHYFLNVHIKGDSVPAKNVMALKYALINGENHIAKNAAAPRYVLIDGKKVNAKNVAAPRYASTIE